ncbi:VOC family protein [Streptomyces sp. NPDC048718]|uniref:VOC family protein n=1 Tax=Streptomyces sp. NPDC048718 TaxID=3365587 RepID=UPI00370FC357
MTALHWKLVIDAADPHAQAAFWAAALDYHREDHSALVTRLLEAGAAPASATITVDGRPAWRDLAAVRHPDEPFDPASDTGLGRRILFQRVPEPKQDGKNRLHLDLHPAPGTRKAEIARLEALGATLLQEVTQAGGSWGIMTDPENNEFCVH